MCQPIKHRSGAIRLFIFILYAACHLSAYTQIPGNTGQNKNSPGKVYALVVGISSYLQKDIPQLQFANRDAEEFSKFLRSKAGGSVPEENISLLTDTAATTGAVYDALYNLSNSCSKGDLVYFYFSGHGDLENVTMYKNGFFICYDSPPNNYVKLSLSIEYLNDIANTLSSQTGANVVLITDACHSGKLAGSRNKGNFLVGDQLRAVKNKEIRITSCASNQLSNENVAWGKGRGIFSYYLINGLKGLADRQKDGIVTLDEIKSYLESSLANDPVMKRENLVQTPVLNGNGGFQLSKVDTATERETEVLVTSSLSLQMDLNPAPLAEEIIPASAQQYFFSLVKKDSLEQLTETLGLNQLTAGEIPFTLIARMKDSVKSDAGKNKLGQLEKSLHDDKNALKKFNGKLAVAFDEKGQQVIDQYLNADEAELERRRYYNSNSNGYDVYPKMFAVAIKLTQPDNFFYNILQVKYHYFNGVAARLKLPAATDPQPLIEKALAEQQKALALEDHAAYIYNEMGILSLAKNKPDEAEKYFLLAIQNAPSWVIPHANLVGLYTRKKNFTKAFEEYNTAKELQPDFQGLNVSAGFLHEQKGNLLLAEEYQRKSIHQNSRHYLPFERLGYVYLNTTQYALADSFFYEADKRKKGFHFIEPLFWINPLDYAYDEIRNCEISRDSVLSNDPIGLTALGIQYLSKGKKDTAEKYLKAAILLDRTNPLAFHYLGKLLYQQQRWQEAEIIFKFAAGNFLDPGKFMKYRDSLNTHYPRYPERQCILIRISMSGYKQVEDHYFMGSLYESWGHLSEAAEQYRTILGIDSGFIGGYYKLWNVWEKLGRYTDAESVITEYKNTDEKGGLNELNAFYRRMVCRFPEEGNWYYKQGKMLYQLALERKNEETYTTVELQIREKNREKEFPEPDISVNTLIKTDSSFHNHLFKFEIPGTKEYCPMSQPIKTPYSEEGIAYLKKADSILNATEDTHAEINDHIGDMFTWLGLPYLASTHYQRSVDARPDNASVRQKLADSYSASYQLKNALDQLDSLRARHEINFPQQLTLAKYLIHSARFPEAQALLTAAERIHPYTVPTIIDLNGRLQLLDGKPAAAIKYYKQMLAIDPTDSMAMYSLARLNARLGNKNEAWKWLEASANNGFGYTFVLNYDPDLEVLRKTARWTRFLNSFESEEAPDKMLPKKLKRIRYN